MATTEVEVIQIDTAQSVKSVQSLKQEIKDLKTQLLNLDKGTEEYNQTLLELGNASHDLKEIQEQTLATNSDFGTMVSNSSKALAGMAGAVSAVTGTLSLLGVNLGDDAKLMKIFVSAMSITSGVAAIDSGVKAVKALGISIKAATQAQKGFNIMAGYNPYLLGATVILGAIAAITKALQGQSKQQQEMHEAERRRHEERLEWEKKEALNRIKYTQDVARFTVDAEEMTTEEIIKKREDLKREIKRLQAEKAKLSEGRYLGVGADQIQTDIDEQLAAYDKQIELANKKLQILNNTKGKAAKTTAANTEATKDEYTAYEKLLNEIELLVATGEDEGEVLQQKIQVEKEHLTELTRGTEAYDKQLIKIAQLNTAYVDYLRNVETATHEEKLNAIERQKNAKMQEAELKRLKSESENLNVSSGAAVTEPTTAKGINENADSKKALIQAEYDTKVQYLNDTFNAEIEAANNELLLAETTAERKKELLQDIEVLTAEHDLRLNELNAEKNEKDLQNDKETAEAKKALMQMQVGFAVAMAQQITGVLVSMADAQEENSKEQKNLQIASAIINTLAGAAGGFAQAMAAYPMPYGAILGAVAMATTLGTGFAQVAKIKATKVSKSASASTPSNTTVQTITNTPTNVRQTSPMWNDEQYIGEQVQQTNEKTDTTVTLVYSEVQNMAETSNEIQTANTI